MSHAEAKKQKAGANINLTPSQECEVSISPCLSVHTNIERCMLGNLHSLVGTYCGIGRQMLARREVKGLGREQVDLTPFISNSRLGYTVLIQACVFRGMAASDFIGW